MKNISSRMFKRYSFAEKNVESKTNKKTNTYVTRAREVEATFSSVSKSPKYAKMFQEKRDGKNMSARDCFCRCWLNKHL